MAWTTPRTWVTGETVTASIMNTHIRDNMNALRSASSSRVYLSGGQSINTATWTAITFDAESFDTPGWHSTVTNNTRITPDITGVYLFVATVQFTASAGGSIRGLRIRLNGSTIICENDLRSLAGAANEVISVTGAYQMNGTTDYVETQAYQDSGGSLALLTASNITSMTAVFLGA